MKKNIKILLLILFYQTSFGQIVPEIFSCFVGKYHCKPDFILITPDTNQISKTHLTTIDKNTSEESSKPFLLQNGQFNEIDIFFKPKLDTVIVDYGNYTENKVIKIDHYSFINVQDSLSHSEINAFFNNELFVRKNNVKQKIVSYCLQILFSDGTQIIKDCKNSKIFKNDSVKKILNTQKEIIYIGISSIELATIRKMHLSIFEGYGWKILNDH